MRQNKGFVRVRFYCSWVSTRLKKLKECGLREGPGVGAGEGLVERVGVEVNVSKWPEHQEDQ